jgi:FkbH-like protein
MKYHMSSEEIIITYIQLVKNCKKDTSNFAMKKLSVLGDCATQHISKAVQGYAVERELALNIFDTDYNQIIAQIFDSDSELYKFNPDYVLIIQCTEKLYEKYCETPNENRCSFADNVLTQIRGYWDKIHSMCKARILQFNFPEIDDKVFGSFADSTESSFVFQLRKLNFLLSDLAVQNKNVFIVDVLSLQNYVGRQQYFDPKLYYIAKMPIALEILPQVAKAVVDVICTLNGNFKKCIILDLDNTLWGGVIGDDGLSGIQIGELGLGHAFSDFQQWLKELKKRGIILAVCSKNDEVNAKEPFINHPDMVLRLDDISAFVANWDDKVSNIRSIQKALNIGFDSMVFIDDNSFERNLVKSMLPQIAVPDLPEDPALYLDFLRSLNLFETASYSSEDESRTKQYQAEFGRNISMQSFGSYDEYLQSLEMKAKCGPFEKFDYPRISQLTQRSNQFNLRTVRYTETEIAKIAESDKYITLSFSLKDNFGDHGLISVVILEKRDDDTLFIETWLMSCRVLRRGMEEFIINKIIDTADKNSFKSVIGEYIKTPKNAMVSDIYGRMGFRQMSDNTYIADVNTFKKNKTYIKEN